MGEKIEFTGERFLQETPEPGIPAQRHWFAYKFSKPFINGKAVLDLGCGEGHSSAYLARKAVKESKDYIPVSAIDKEDFKIINFETERVLDLLAVCGDG